MNIIEMTKSFKDNNDWQEFAEAQQKTIVQLSRRLVELEAKNKDLEKSLLGAMPLVATGPMIPELDHTFESDEEAISVLELAKLRNHTHIRELTFEEAKKVELYTKILSAIKEKRGKAREEEIKTISDEELMNAINVPNDTKQ